MDNAALFSDFVSNNLRYDTCNEEVSTNQIENMLEKASDLDVNAFLDVFSDKDSSHLTCATADYTSEPQDQHFAACYEQNEQENDYYQLQPDGSFVKYQQNDSENVIEPQDQHVSGHFQQNGHEEYYSEYQTDGSFANYQQNENENGFEPQNQYFPGHFQQNDQGEYYSEHQTDDSFANYQQSDNGNFTEQQDQYFSGHFQQNDHGQYYSEYQTDGSCVNYQQNDNGNGFEPQNQYFSGHYQQNQYGEYLSEQDQHFSGYNCFPPENEKAKESDEEFCFSDSSFQSNQRIQKKKNKKVKKVEKRKSAVKKTRTRASGAPKVMKQSSEFYGNSFQMRESKKWLSITTSVEWKEPPLTKKKGQPSKKCHNCHRKRKGCCDTQPGLGPCTRCVKEKCACEWNERWMSYVHEKNPNIPSEWDTSLIVFKSIHCIGN